MAQWLAPILGVVVVGVLLELITKDSRLGQFIRGIYAFFVLLVLVQPLPTLFKHWRQAATSVAAPTANEKIAVNETLVKHLTQTGQQAQITQQLADLGYPDALVQVQDGAIYVNLGQTVSDEVLALLKRHLGGTEVYVL